MSKGTRALLALVLSSAGLAGAEEPPYRRLLQEDDARKAAALGKQIGELWAAGKFAEAVAPAEELLALRQRVQGKGHWEAADAARRVRTLRQAAALPAEKQASLAEAPGLAAQADTLHDRGKYADAVPLLRKALAVCEEVLGPKHPDTARLCNDLATNLEAMGQVRDAEPLHRRALAIWEEALGPRHPHTATSLGNLAWNLDLQGRRGEAEPLHRKALAIQEEVLGPKHPEIAMGLGNLALNLDAQGRPGEAEPLHRKALAVKEEALGAKHPETATSCDNLACNLQLQGRVREAEPLFRRALALNEEALGASHPQTARSYHNLAINLDVQGRWKEAEPLHRKALAVRQAVLGPTHSLTISSLNNLGGNLLRQGRGEEAEPLFRKTIAVFEEKLGPRHPDVATACTNLAATLRAQQRYQEAEPLLRKALAIREGVLGPKHPDTARAWTNLAVNLRAQGRIKEAEPLLRKAVAVCEEVLGPQHPLTVNSVNSLAFNLQAQGRYKEAEPFWQKGADGKEVVRLRLAGSALDKAVAVEIDPHLGLAACRARLERPLEAWQAAEAGLGRGPLDELADVPAFFPDPARDRRLRDRAARLEALDKVLVPLLRAEKLDEVNRRRRDELLQERDRLDREAADDAAEQSRQALLSLKDIQKHLDPASALVLWIDISATGDHWGCIVRHSGPPAWVRLPGSGPQGAWTEADDRLPALLRDDLSHGEPDALRRARLLAAQRLDPLASHLAASADLPAVRHLVVVPVSLMAGVPVEVLTERYRVSYAPSGSLFARLRDKRHRADDLTLLALGDPNFALPDAGPPPQPPDHGLYLALVLPGGNAARIGLRAGDVLLRHGGVKLVTRDDLQWAEGGESVPVVVWRDGKVRDDLRLAPGKLGVVFSDDPPAVALRKRREREVLADARSRGNLSPLLATRLEVVSLAGLLPRDRATVLVGSRASEQELDSLNAAGKLESFRRVRSLSCA